MDEESYSLRVGEKKEKAKQKRLMKEKKGIAQAENFINTSESLVGGITSQFTHRFRLS